MVSGCGVTEVSHPPRPSMLRCLTRPTMQAMRRLTQAAALIPLLISLHVARLAPPTTNGPVCVSAASGQTWCDRAVSWHVREAEPAIPGVNVNVNNWCADHSKQQLPCNPVHMQQTARCKTQASTGHCVRTVQQPTRLHPSPGDPPSRGTGVNDGHALVTQGLWGGAGGRGEERSG